MPDILYFYEQLIIDNHANSLYSIYIYIYYILQYIYITVYYIYYVVIILCKFYVIKSHKYLEN